MIVTVDKVLFRKLQSSNAGALMGDNRGEHDIRIGRMPEIEEFTAGVPVTEHTSLGGWTKVLSIEPFDGPNPAPAQELRIRYMGPQAQRRDDTYFARQTAHPYELWKPARAHPGATDAQDLVGDVAIVIRDTEGRMHARWLRQADISSLPNGLRTAIEANERGVYTVPSSPAPSPAAAKVIAALRSHVNVLLYGPPGTGKTHLVSEVRKHFGGNAVTLDTSVEHGGLSGGGTRSLHSAWATFHQSYSYEDFLVGLRPKPTGQGFVLEAHPGVLLELAEWARIPGRESLLIIDEINRGNVSRIFGEFITLMELDKRVADDGSETEQTVAVRLPFIDEGQAPEVLLPDGTKATVTTPFTMPRRVYTLATMNSVDKSVAPLDSALRRRFHVINIAPDIADFATTHLRLSGNPVSEGWTPKSPRELADYLWLGAAALGVINKRIALFLGNDYELGEWFLRPLIDAKDPTEAAGTLAELWRTSIMPQIEDYFVGRADQLNVVLGEPPETALALVIAKPDTREVEVGASPSIRGNPSASDADVIKLLEALVNSSGLPAVPGVVAPPASTAEPAEQRESAPGVDGGGDALG